MHITRRSCLSILLGVFGGLTVGLILIQFLPLGKERSNPPVVAEPAWDSPHTRELFVRACADCHSNQTHWPWYSRIAPISWLVVYDVDKGRSHFNVSEWGSSDQDKAEEAAELLMHDEMPPRQYLILHPEARLSAGDRDALAGGLFNTFGGEIGTHEDD